MFTLFRCQKYKFSFITQRKINKSNKFLFEGVSLSLSLFVKIFHSQNFLRSAILCSIFYWIHYIIFFFILENCAHENITQPKWKIPLSSFFLPIIFLYFFPHPTMWVNQIDEHSKIKMKSCICGWKIIGRIWHLELCYYTLVARYLGFFFVFISLN